MNGQESYFLLYKNSGFPVITAIILDRVDYKFHVHT